MLYSVVRIEKTHQNLLTVLVYANKNCESEDAAVRLQLLHLQLQHVIAVRGHIRAGLVPLTTRTLSIAQGGAASVIGFGATYLGVTFT